MKSHHYLAVAVVAVTACANFGRQPNFYSINADGTRSDRYARVNEYTSYQGIGQQAKIAADFDAAEHAPAPSLPIEVFNASLPPGVTIESGALQIAKDAPYEAIGRYELGYWLASAPDETQIQDDLVRLAAVTHANVVVVEVTRVAHGDPRVNFLAGVLLRKRGNSDAPGATPASAPTVAAAGPRPHRKLALVYRANARGCLSADEFADEVSAKLGYSPWVPAASAPTTLSTTLASHDGIVHATVAFDADRQDLSGANCKLATDAAVSAIIVRLER